MKLRTKSELEIEALTPYSFENNIRKWTRYGSEWFWSSPFETRTNDSVWSGLRLSDGTLLGVKVRSVGSSLHPKLRLDIFSDDRISNTQENEALMRTARCLGTNDDIAEFYENAARNPVLKQAVRNRFGMRPIPLPELFDSLILAITLQMASRGRTEQMIKLIFQNYGEKLNFDGHNVIVCPNAAKIAIVPLDELRLKCKLGYRAPYLKSNSAMLASNSALDYEFLSKKTSVEAKRILSSMKGIGNYSVEVMLYGIHVTFPVDSWSQRIFRRAFKMSERSSMKETLAAVQEFAQLRFCKWKGHVFDYIVNDPETAKKMIKN